MHAVIFVYDITSSGSFGEVTNHVDEFDKHNSGFDHFKVLVGNKCDL